MRVSRSTGQAIDTAALPVTLRVAIISGAVAVCTRIVNLKLPDVCHYRFYEKVLNVKADVAAILAAAGYFVLPGMYTLGSISRFPRCSGTADVLPVEEQRSGNLPGSTHSCRASIRTLNEPLGPGAC